MASGVGLPGGISLPMLNLGVTRDVAFAAAGGASARSSALAAAGIGFLVANPGGGSDVRYQIAAGTGSTASATTGLILKGAMVAIKANPGDTIAFLSNDTGTGSVNVTDVL